MIIKISDNNDIGLVSLFNIDIENLTYTKILNGVGSMEFTLNIASEKVTEKNIRVYNRIRLEEDGKTVFSGYIIQNRITLNTVSVRCLGLMGMLRVRVSPFNQTFSGSVNDTIKNLLTIANENQSTGISAGNIVGVGTVSRQTNGDNIYDVISDMVSGTANQFRFNDHEGTLDVKPFIGKDLSNDVILRFDTRMVKLSNIANFSVDDNGDSVVSVSYGRVDANTDNIQDDSLVEKYGRVEKNTAYRTISNTDLATQITSELSGSEYTPDLTLLPNVPDVFDIGDIVGVKLYNGIVDINTKYQILEKEVTYNGSEKIIRIKVNRKQSDLTQLLLKQQKELSILSNHI
jgi:hypothetical protein